ncbi:MAG: hypothetical protein GX447_07915 [Elusimicrobia bacterium]|nr:hypothetical protein [Elusimicrobiota bacterium]
MSFNREDENKKGFLPLISRIFSGGAKGATSMGKAAGAAGIFSSKAGLLGVILGGATIAAGVGVVYNLIGPSSGKVYTADLFQNAYYQEQAKKASIEREGVRNMASQSASSLDMFREQAKKEGLASDEQAAKEGEAASSADASAADSSSAAPDAAGAAGDGGKLNASLGFNNAKGGGGSGTSGGKLQTSGGFFGNMGKKQFSPMGGMANLSSAGSASAMKGALASNVKNSPKYTVPNIKRSGSFGQAKYAGKVGQKAAYSASDSGSRSAAEAAFTGETAGSGDVATPTGGTGIGGAGVSDGAKLKANDPNINTNEYQPPTPENKEVDSPWKKLEDKIFNTILIAAGLVALATLMAKSKNPYIMAAAVILAYAAIATALYEMYLGWQMWSEYKQKWSAIMYMIVGAGIIYAAIQALSGVGKTCAESQTKDLKFLTKGFWKAIIPGF